MMEDHQADPELLETVADAAFEAAMDLESHHVGDKPPESVISFLSALRQIPGQDGYLTEAVPKKPYDTRSGTERISILVLEAAKDANLIPAAAAAVLAAHDALLLASQNRSRYRH